MKPFLPSVRPCVLPIALPIALLACGAPEAPPAVSDPTEAIVAAPVEAPPAAPEFPGVITSRQHKVIPAEFAGQIKRIAVHQRKRVKAGDLVATLDDTELRAELASLVEQEKSLRAEAGSYGAQARAARQQLRTDGILVSRGVAPRNALRTATANYQAAAGQAGAASARAGATRFKRQQLEDLLAKAELVSPIDGIITVVNVKEGEVAQKGLPIARVFDDRDLMIRFAVPEEHRASIREGLRVELRLGGVERPIWATIERIADEAPPITFTVVEADIDDTKLHPDEIQVASEGRVRIADTQPGAQ